MAADGGGAGALVVHDESSGASLEEYLVSALRRMPEVYDIDSDVSVAVVFGRSAWTSSNPAYVSVFQRNGVPQTIPVGATNLEWDFAARIAELRIAATLADAKSEFIARELESHRLRESDERKQKETLLAVLREKEETLRAVTMQRDEFKRDLEAMRRELAEQDRKHSEEEKALRESYARVTRDLLAMKARLWCGAIVSQFNEHARNHVFTPEKVERERLYKVYDDVFAMKKARGSLDQYEAKRLLDIERIIADLEANLLGGANFDNISRKWLDSRRGDAHPDEVELEDGTRVPPTDDVLVPFIVGLLAGCKPFATQEVLEPNVKTMLSGLHRVAELVGKGGAPFDLD